MSKFFIGQRVRIVGTQYFGTGPSPTGEEARITRRGVIGETTGFPYEWEVTTAHGRRVQCNGCELEPILPEGHTPSVYSFEELMDKCRSGVVA